MDKDALREQLRRLGEASAKIGEAMKPFREAAHAIDEVREDLLEQNDADVAGPCANCRTIILVGEQGYKYDSDELFCAECSPTWKDAHDETLESQGRDNLDDEEMKRAERFIASYHAHIEAGGKPTDKLTFEL